MRGRLLSLSLLAVLPLAAAEQALLFYSGQQQLEQVKTLVDPMPKACEAWDWQYMELSSAPQGVQDAHAHAEALRYGVMLTPSLIILGEDGRYHCLAGTDLSPVALESYLAQPQADEGQLPDERMGHLATMYEQSAIIASPNCSEDQLCVAIMYSRKALSSDSLTIEDKQLVGLRLLYPLLLRQYTRARKAKGAHTPQNEAKLLEAVSALEAARDLDLQSSLGREAYEQREELRRARIKARSYE